MSCILIFITRGRLLMALLVAALLSACGGPAAQAPIATQLAVAATSAATATSAPAATSAPRPTDGPQPTAAPAATAAPQPTAAPAAEGILPAPLYFVGNPQGQNNQIWRIERDGKTRTKIVEEPPAKEMLTIVEFDVSPTDGALAYLIQEAGGTTLVRIDAGGKNRKELLPAGSVNTPRWSPDGKTIAVAISPVPDATEGLAGGVYLIPAGGGEPKLLQANDPIKDPANPPPEARGFAPAKWSPDGSKLLLSAFSQVVDACDVAIKTVASGELVTLVAPEGMTTRCDSGAWSHDGKSIYVGMTRPGYLAPVPGLWRADAATGETKPFIPGEPVTGRFTLVNNPHVQPHGSVRAFVATTDKIPQPGVDPHVGWPNFALYEVSADGEHGQNLRSEMYANPGELALWAPDGSGVLIDLAPATPGANSTLTWVPASNAPTVQLADDITASAARWGSLNAE